MKELLNLMVVHELPSYMHDLDIKEAFAAFSNIGKAAFVAMAGEENKRVDIARFVDMSSQKIGYYMQIDSPLLDRAIEFYNDLGVDKPCNNGGSELIERVAQLERALAEIMDNLSVSE